MKDAPPPTPAVVPMGSPDPNAALRDHVARLLDWEDAHVAFDAAVEGVPPAVRGTPPAGLPHSPWELLEHLRLTQRDILEFCGDALYTERRWPDDYWPPSPALPTPGTWDESVARFRADRAALQRLVRDPGLDLLAPVPHGSGQTYLREVLLVADHTAYHVGQLVTARQALGLWPAP